MSIFKANISLLNNFLKHFPSCFTKKQMAIFVHAVSALFKDYKRNSLDAMANTTNTKYQTLQYFFSDSKWGIQVMPEADSLWRTIQQKRLEIIQKQRTYQKINILLLLNIVSILVSVIYYNIKNMRN